MIFLFIIDLLALFYDVWQPRFCSRNLTNKLFLTHFDYFSSISTVPLPDQKCIMQINISQHCDLEIQIEKIGKDFDFFYVTKKKDLNISISLDHQKKCIYYDKTTDVYKIR